MNNHNPRQIAANVLTRPAGGGFIEDRLDHALAQANLSPPDRRLCQELVYGVIRWQATLDWLIAGRTDGRVQKPGLQILLRLGLYQLFWLDRIPAHAAVNETVKQAREGGFESRASFVNALLRGLLREEGATRRKLEELKTAQPHLGYSHPEWLAKRSTARWGAEKAAKLMEWNNTPPKTFARVNALKTSAEQLLARWQEEKVEFDPVARDWLAPNLAFELKQHPPLAELGSFKDGWFYIQDPGTLLAVHELDPQPGETIFDPCAAPGGKFSFVAQLMKNQGRLVGSDLSADRLKLVSENCARLGVTNAELLAPADLDAGQPVTFDRILIDAPCSNTGVMRRRVDLRWRIREEEIQRLRKVQLDLLIKAAPRLKPGGVLLYSTCSLEAEENSEVVKEFLAAHADFKLEQERELLPFKDEVDGAYVTRLRKS